MEATHAVVCLACHAHANDESSLGSCEATGQVHDRHDITEMTEAEYCAWADARSMDHDDGGW